MISAEVRHRADPQDVVGYLPIASEGVAWATFQTPGAVVTLPVETYAELPFDLEDPVRRSAALIADSEAIDQVRSLPEFLEAEPVPKEIIDLNSCTAQEAGARIVHLVVLPAFATITEGMDELDRIAFWASAVASIGGAMACSVGLIHANTIIEAVKPMMAEVIATVRGRAH